LVAGPGVEPDIA